MQAEDADLFKIVNDPEKGECLTLSDGWSKFLRVGFIFGVLLDMKSKLQAQCNIPSSCVLALTGRHNLACYKGIGSEFAQDAVADRECPASLLVPFLSCTGSVFAL